MQAVIILVLHTLLQYLSVDIFATNRVSCTPVSSVHGGDHVLVPFSMEDGGRFGALALALLKLLAEVRAV